MLWIQNISLVIIVASTLHNIYRGNVYLYEDFSCENEEEVNGFVNVLPPQCAAEDDRNQLMLDYC